MSGSISTINGVALWHMSQGQGIPIVLLHGGPGAYDYLEQVAKLLDDHYQVIRYEQRGSWRSEKKGPYNVVTFIEDLEHLRIELGFDSWIVCGHSWGASLALGYTAKYHSRVKALIYISGTGINPQWHEDYRVNRLNTMSDKDREEYTYLRSIINTLDGERKERAKDRIRELSLRSDLYNQKNYDKLPRVESHFVNNEVNQKVGSDANRYFENTEFEEVISSITTLSLFIHGEVDPRPYTYAKELSNKLHNSKFTLIPNAGHYPWLDNPADLRNKIIEFLNEQL